MQRIVVNPSLQLDLVRRVVHLSWNFRVRTLVNLCRRGVFERGWQGSHVHSRTAVLV